jgi:hypothetical protein
VNEIINFCSHITEGANIVEFAEIFQQKTFGDIEPPCIEKNSLPGCLCGKFLNNDIFYRQFWYLFIFLQRFANASSGLMF